MKPRTQQITQEFYQLHPDLLFLQEALSKALGLLLEAFRAGGKLLICATAAAAPIASTSSGS